MATSRRAFTAEFKAEAVRRITEGRKSLAEVARELDLGESLLRSWKQALAAKGDRAFPSKGNLPAVEEELRRLRAENQQLRAERDILPLNASIARPPISADSPSEAGLTRASA